jgi:TRAP transporter 4TM/12TM fusion protein
MDGSPLVLKGEYMKRFVDVVAVLSTLFVVFAVSTRYFSGMESLGVYLAMVLLLAFLTKPLSKTNSVLRSLDYLFAVASIAVGFYSFFFAEGIANRVGDSTFLDLALGVVAIILVLEATRRVAGLAIVFLCLFFLGYAYFGNYFPELIATKGFGIERISSAMYLTLSGIYGLPLKVMFDYIILFIVFGAFLEVTGGITLFINLSMALMGRYTGGQGKIAVIASGLMGMISGSAVANVATVGTFTIPAMKKSGYDKTFAGAVESIASTGGQLMPPVMGAAAFVMADYIEVPYATICLRAAIPAVIYYFILGLTIHFYAQRHRLYGLPKAELPQLGEVIRNQGLLMLSLVAIIAGLVLGYSPTMAALSGLAVLLIVCWVKPESRLTWKKVYQALHSSGMAGVQVGVTSASAGIILGVFMLTGLGTKIASVLIQISGGSVLVLLIISMLTSIAFGMGMPTTPCYILLATLVGPALISMGVDKVLAHLFLFYFGMLSMITPPVAMAAYTAAAISGDSFYRTGFLAWRMALPIFILPYFFVYYPGLALMGSWSAICSAVFSALVGLTACCIGLTGYFRGELRYWERGVLLLGGLSVIHKSLVTDIVGVVILALFLVWKMRKPDQARPAEKGVVSAQS